ncbi:MAG: shikimate kinase [Thermoplasmata archaeon]|jgi:shikimate kinase
MHGIGRASAAITIVNALPTGVGCAVGIGLYATAEVHVRPTRKLHRPTLEIPAETRTPLVEEALRSGLARYFPSLPSDATLALHSEIPVARGLKSSSAVACAVLSAVAQAADAAASPIEIARLSADVAQETGVSATGALDDALAGLSPGFVLTDNHRRTLLREGPVDSGWEVALFVPPTSHRPSPEWSAAFRARFDEGAVAVAAAREGDWWAAMHRNTELVESVMGYPYAALRQKLRDEGALAVGVSGLGPTLAAVAPRDRIEGILDALPVDGGLRLRVPFCETREITAGGLK